MKKDRDTYVIDAKWKIIDESSIGLNDMLKLKRDAEIRSLDANVYAILIYFSIGEDRMIQEFLHNDTTSTFSFYATQISFLENCFHLQQFKQVAISLMVINNLVDDFQEAKQSTFQDLIEMDIEDEDVSTLIDNQLIKQVEQLGQTVQQYYAEEDILADEDCQKIHTFLIHNKDVLEDECRSFIESAISTAFYFNKFIDVEKQFDYSLPASGIWKSIEVELNASIIFIIRYISGVCEKEAYYIRKKGSNDIHIKTGYRRNQIVFLTNAKKLPNRMDNILLGSFPHILKNIDNTNTFDHHHTLKIFEPIFEKYYFDTCLSIEEWTQPIIKFLFYLIGIRNPHTHKDLMKQVTYQNFIDYIFCNEEFNFADLVQLKRNIIEYINDVYQQ